MARRLGLGLLKRSRFVKKVRVVIKASIDSKVRIPKNVSIGARFYRKGRVVMKARILKKFIEKWKSRIVRKVRIPRKV